MPDFDLSISIASWNTREDLRQCIESLLACKDNLRFEVIVFDNASTDGSPEMVETCFPSVRLIRSEVNLGFGKAHNLAFQHAHSDLFFPLNSDTIVSSGSLEMLVDYIKSHAMVGIVAPRLLNPDGSLQFSCRRFPTPIAALFRNTPLGKLFPKNRFTRDYLMADWDHDSVKEVDWVSGAAFCIRSDLFKKLDGFDERFFMYFEDVDLCYRTWQAGYKVIYLPHATIVHAIGKSTDIVANKMIRQLHRSMMRFYKKHYLKSLHPMLRPFALILGNCVLFIRSSIFITKNNLDVIRRRFTKS